MSCVIYFGCSFLNKAVRHFALLDKLIPFQMLHPLSPPHPSLHGPYLGHALIGLNSMHQKHFVSMSAYCRGVEAPYACVCVGNRRMSCGAIIYPCSFW